MQQIFHTIVGFATLPCIFIAGLICNLSQFIIYHTIKPVNVNLFRKLNHYLQYYYHSLNVNVVDRFTNLKCYVTFSDHETMSRYMKYSNLVIANHRYDIDWLVFWLLSDKFGLLGGDKALIKSDLLKVPVVGWGWALCDMIALKRSWTDDSEHLEKALECWLTYEIAPLIVFAEGTRFTEAKHEVSMRFAEEKNLPLRLKHHLIPRTKGFALMARKIRSNYLEHPNEPRSKCGIFNLEVLIKGEENVSMPKILCGQHAELHIHAELITPDKIPDTDEKIVDLLYDMYRKKDEWHDYFAKNGRFPPGYDMGYKPRLLTHINWLFWMLLVYGTFFYYLGTTLYQGITEEFTTSHLVFLSSTIVLIATTCVAIKFMLDSANVSKSSDYGMGPTSKSKST